MHFSVIPHWLAVAACAGFLSVPFILFSVYRCGALNPRATAPYTHYQRIVLGVNLLFVGGFFALAGYYLLGVVDMVLGVWLALKNIETLNWWYRRNPQYHWRLLTSKM